MNEDEKYLLKKARSYKGGILKRKGDLKESYVGYMLDRTNTMFEYSGLPDTIPAPVLEYMLQCAGFVVIVDTRDEADFNDIPENERGLTAFICGLGGAPDVYLRPTEAIIANPHYQARKKIGDRCVLIKNDFLMMGLLPMHDKYASLMTEADVSLKWTLINSRVMSAFKASNDSVAESVRKYLSDVEEGVKLGVIVAPNFANETLSGVDVGKSSAPLVKQVIEGEQYIRASWFNEIGLQANYNMKREAINDAEAGMNEDSLSPLVDEMTQCRTMGFDDVNRIFGENIAVKLASTWNEENNDGKQEEGSENED